MSFLARWLLPALVMSPAALSKVPAGPRQLAGMWGPAGLCSRCGLSHASHGAACTSSR